MTDPTPTTTPHVLRADKISLWCGAPLPNMPTNCYRTAGHALLADIGRTSGRNPDALRPCPDCLDAISAYYADSEE